MFSIKKGILDLLTENDGISLCPIRVFAFALSIPTIGIFAAAGIMQLIHGHLDIQGFASAFATLSAGFAAFGASVSVKALTDRR
jgi:hypothetical protein